MRVLTLCRHVQRVRRVGTSNVITANGKDVLLFECRKAMTHRFALNLKDEPAVGVSKESAVKVHEGSSIRRPLKELFMTRKIRPFTLLFSHHVALACLCLFMGLTTLSGVALAENPAPLINQPLVPDTIKPGAASFTLTVNGTGFVSGAVVKWNGNARTTNFVSHSKLSASILASDVAKASTASVDRQ